MKQNRLVKQVIKHLFHLVLLVLCVSFLSFLLLEVSPIDPVQAFVRSLGHNVPLEQKQRLIQKWGLDQPFMLRYLSWLKHFVLGDAGMSMVYERPVSQVIHEGFSSSFVVMFVAFILQGIVGVYLGIVSGVHENQRKDKAILRYCMIMSSTPSYWVAMLLIMLFGVWLKWLPYGFSSPIGVLESDVTILDRISHMILPILTLVLVGVSDITLHTREKVIEIMHADYIVYAKSRGLKGMDLIKRYGLKNVLLPAITIQFASFSGLFSGIVLIETAFQYPGLGGISVKAGLSGDLPLLLAITVYSAVLVYIGNAIADVLYGVLDPRLKPSKGVQS